MARDVWLRRLLLCPKGGQINDRFSDRLFTAQLITRPKSSFPYYTARIPDRNLTYIWKFVVRRFRRYMSETRISRYCIRGKIEMIIDTGHFHRYSLWKPLQSRRIKCSIDFYLRWFPSRPHPHGTHAEWCHSESLDGLQNYIQKNSRLIWYTFGIHLKYIVCLQDSIKLSQHSLHHVFTSYAYWPPRRRRTRWRVDSFWML